MLTRIKLYVNYLHAHRSTKPVERNDFPIKFIPETKDQMTPT